jgi:hypothetical protein
MRPFSLLVGALIYVLMLNLYVCMCGHIHITHIMYSVLINTKYSVLINTKI